ncbi:MAG: hypothetical protein RR500_04050 [Bacilli bacterium]
MNKIKNYIILVLCIVIVFLVVNIAIANVDKQYALNNYKRVQEEKTELLNINADLQVQIDALKCMQEEHSNNKDTRD